ncbi:hypothetical protein GE061_001496 [Apolygus lucorum]|uniref:Uncharacterized protein n=1 Tax=Apolygus lucorum TaxID=248454 RepID=A0A6A4KID2_APOLU|nr:hypothetical protein GE061_001496 [Apolygus lucorum]
MDFHGFHAGNTRSMCALQLSMYAALSWNQYPMGPWSLSLLHTMILGPCIPGQSWLFISVGCSNPDNMYPGLNCNLEYDSAFGFLAHLNSDELKALLNDESKLEEMAKEQKQYRDLEKEKEMLLASNQSLAEYNLSLQPRLDQTKQELLEKTEVCDQLLQSLESKSALLGEKSGRSVLDSKLSSLQLATSELEETSEGYADNFLSGECDVEEFLDKFLSGRKQMHLEKVKADKMAEMLKQYQTGF